MTHLSLHPTNGSKSLPTGQKVPRFRKKTVGGYAYGVVTVNGKDHYCGPFDDPDSRQKYDQLIGEWLASGRQAPKPATAERSVNEILAAYVDFARTYYVSIGTGQPNKEFGHLQNVVRVLRENFGRVRAKDFGPLRLKAVRQKFIDAGHCRKNVNANTQRVKRIFRWAVSNELIEPTGYHALQSVEGLRYGRSAAAESEPVRPVPTAYVDAILPHVLPEVATMIRLQLATGMRSGELCSMRTCDIDATGDIWCYRPVRHKTQHHGHTREVWIGPKAQTILQPWLRMNTQDYLFSPRRARSTEFAACPTHQRHGKPRKGSKRLTDRYSVTAYYRAVRDGCDKAEREARGFVPPFTCSDCGKVFPKWAGLTVHTAKKHGRKLARPSIEGERQIPRWHPHQLRHNAATEIRKQFGIEVARAVLGQSTITAAAIYAEMDQAAARNVAKRIG